MKETEAIKDDSHFLLRYSVKYPTWSYFNVKVTIDKQFFTNNTEEDEIKFDVDKISWKLLISSSLRKLYGLIGESSHYDILMNSGSRAVIRTYNEDRQKFQNSFMTYTFDLSRYLGEEYEGAFGYIQTMSVANYLGLVIGNDDKNLKY